MDGKEKEEFDVEAWVSGKQHNENNNSFNKKNFNKLENNINNDKLTKNFNCKAAVKNPSFTTGMFQEVF